MQTRNAVAAIAVLGLLAGCETVKIANPVTPAAHGQNCRGMSICNVPVDPNAGVVPFEIFVTPGQSTTVRWMLDPNGPWSWRGRGIEFDAASAGSVECPMFQMGPVRTCHTTPGTRGRFYYAVHLVNWSAMQNLDWDPYLVNE